MPQQLQLDAADVLEHVHQIDQHVYQLAISRAENDQLRTRVEELEEAVRGDGQAAKETEIPAE